MSDRRLITEVGAYIPIHISSLVSESVGDFNLYILSVVDEPPVLYRERALPFTEADRRRLNDSEVYELYVQESDAGKLRIYVEKNLGHILSDSSIDASERANLAYHVSQGLVADVFEDPRSRETIQRSKELVLHMAEFILQDPRALSDLMKVMSFDYDTYKHSVNVFVFGMSLARHCGYDDIAELRELGYGLLLHDIGKTELDVGLVTFKGIYDPGQFEEMKKHSVYGYEILKEHNLFGTIALEVVRNHHEKLSGGGYPNNLSGDRISPFARIAAIVEVFDSLTTQRPYQEAVGSFAALELMRNEMMDDLDESLFRSFVEMLGASA